MIIIFSVKRNTFFPICATIKIIKALNKQNDKMLVLYIM